MEFPAEYRKDMHFVKSMFSLVSTYRDFEIEEHPAILNLKQDQIAVEKDELWISIKQPMLSVFSFDLLNNMFWFSSMIKV